MTTLLLASVVLSFITGCSHDDDSDDKKPRKPKRVRDPVEHKVFYEGWWPESW